MNGGAKDFATDAEGFFVFRYEEAEIAASLLGRARYDAMLQKGMRPDRYGRVPLVYRFDMSRPDSLLAGQTFPVNNRDVIYVSRHLTTDIAKFLGIVEAAPNSQHWCGCCASRNGYVQLERSIQLGVCPLNFLKRMRLRLPGITLWAALLQVNTHLFSPADRLSQLAGRECCRGDLAYHLSFCRWTAGALLFRTGKQNPRG